MEAPMARRHGLMSADPAERASDPMEFALLGWAAGTFAGFVLGLGAAMTAAGVRQPTRRPASVAKARNPLEIPAQGWRAILGRTLKEFNEDQVPAVAAGATFFALLSIFPALGAFVALYGLFADVGDARHQVASLAGVLPSGAIGVMKDQIDRLAAQNHSRLGLTFAVGLIVSLWASNAGIKALIGGLNIAYEQREHRGFLILNLVSLSFTIGAVLFTVTGVAAIAAVPATLTALHATGLVGLSALRWPILLLAVTVFLSLLYRFGPCRRHARWRWITPGSSLAALGWMIMSLLFSWYVANFGHYDRTYGSLGAVVGFMTWIWLSLIVVMLGAELNSEIEAQTLVDTTTTGPPRPRGSRGASVADHKA
jgi:membrane protein